jgi:hypothetical protein
LKRCNVPRTAVDRGPRNAGLLRTARVDEAVISN